MSSLKDGTDRVAVVIDTNGTVVGLDTAAKGSSSGSRIRDKVVGSLGADASNELDNCYVSFSLHRPYSG